MKQIYIISDKVNRFKTIIANKNKIISELNNEKNNLFEVHQHQSRQINLMEAEI